MADATHASLPASPGQTEAPNRCPQILTVNGNVRIEGNDRMAFASPANPCSRASTRLPLFNGLIGLVALLLAASAMWWREGR